MLARRHRIAEKLGQGDMGEACRAEDLELPPGAALPISAAVAIHGAPCAAGRRPPLRLG